MNIEIRNALPGQEHEFADLRARAMFKSLSAINRYDDTKVRNRLLESYQIENTKSVYFQNKLVGFYSIEKQNGYMNLKHFYLEPTVCGQGIGTKVMEMIKKECAGIPLRLNALKESEANSFYLKNGFVKTHEEEFDNYYSN